MSSSVGNRGAGDSFRQVVRDFDAELIKAKKGVLQTDDFNGGTLFQNYYVAFNKGKYEIIGLKERVIIAFKSLVGRDVPQIIDFSDSNNPQDNAIVDKATLLNTINDVYKEKLATPRILGAWKREKSVGDRKERAAAAPPPAAAAAADAPRAAIPLSSIHGLMAQAGLPESDIPPPPPEPPPVVDLIRELEEQVKSLKGQLDKASSKGEAGPPVQPAAVAVPNPELRSLQADNQRLNAALASLQKEDDGLKENLTQVSSERDGLKAQLASVRAELTKLSEESQKLQEKHAGAVATNVTDRSTLKQKTAEIEELQSAFKAKAAQLEEAQKTMRGLDTVMTSRAEALKASLTTAHGIEKQKTMTRITALEKTLEKLTDQLKAKDEQLATLQAQADESRALVTKTQSEREKVVSELNAQQQTVVDVLKAQVAQLKAQLNEFKQEAPKLRGAAQQFAASQKDLKKANDDLAVLRRKLEDSTGRDIGLIRIKAQLADAERSLTTTLESARATSREFAQAKGQALEFQRLLAASQKELEVTKTQLRFVREQREKEQPVPVATSAGGSVGKGKAVSAAAIVEADKKDHEELDQWVDRAKPTSAWVTKYGNDRQLEKITAKQQLAKALSNSYAEIIKHFTDLASKLGAIDQRMQALAREESNYKPTAADVVAGKKKEKEADFKARLEGLEKEKAQIQAEYAKNLIRLKGEVAKVNYFGESQTFPENLNDAITASKQIERDMQFLENDANIAKANEALEDLVSKEHLLNQLIENRNQAAKYVKSLESDSSKSKELIQAKKALIQANALYEEALIDRTAAKEVFIMNAQLIKK
jgi:DNA repair exonuclease SbcCD ATPase subunit